MSNEHLAENIIQIYQEYGLDWTQLRGNHLYEKVWLDRFLALLPASASVLDLGCGSGRPIAAYLIENDCQITGVDRSEPMLQLAQQYFPEQTWINADIRQLHLTKKFHGILAWDSLFHLTPNDQRQMLSRFSDFATIGAALMFTSGPSHGEAIGEMFGKPLYHASLDPTEYQALLVQYGFKVIKMVVEDTACTGHTVWLVKRN